MNDMSDKSTLARLFVLQSFWLDHFDIFMPTESGVKNQKRDIFLCSVLIGLMLKEHCILITVQE